MTLFALIPVKPFRNGKARLADVLSPESRAALCRRMFEHVLDAACAARGVDGVAVVSRDETVRVIAESRGADYVEETETGGLNEALMLARAHATGRLATAVMALPADLAFVTSADIAELARAATPPAITIAPDEDGEGTNALLLAPPELTGFSFGTGSFEAHCAAARKAGVDPAIVERPGLTFDVDTAADLARIADRYPLF